MFGCLQCIYIKCLFSTIIPYHLRCSDAYNVYTSNASFSTIIRIILDVRMLTMYIHQMPLFPRLFRIILDVRTLVCFFHFIDTMFIIVQYIVVFQRIRKDPCMIYSISEIKKTNIKWKYNSTNSNYIFQIRERFNFFSK
jgi:hypothetical protein